MTSPEVFTDTTQECLFTRTESGEVVFQYTKPFDRKTGEYDDYYGRFSIDEIEKGRLKLDTSGSCKIPGYNCTLEISKVDGLFRISFDSENRGLTFTTKTLEGFL